MRARGERANPLIYVIIPARFKFNVAPYFQLDPLISWYNNNLKKQFK